MPIHIHPVAALAPRVLLPGDPGRAMEMAIELLGPGKLMFNHSRGLWGYTGTAPDGQPLTIQSTGIGGPSAAVVLEELARLGARIAIRAGTARALAGDVGLGELIAADDGDPELLSGLRDDCDRTGAVVSTDSFYTPEVAEADALALDMETDALRVAARRLGVRFASVVLVTGSLKGPERIGGAELEDGVKRLATAAFRSISKAQVEP